MCAVQVLRAIEKLCGGPDGSKAREIPAGLDVAVWVDYSCIDQDDAPAAELANIGRVIEASGGAGCTEHTRCPRYRM